MLTLISASLLVSRLRGGVFSSSEGNNDCERLRIGIKIRKGDGFALWVNSHL